MGAGIKKLAAATTFLLIAVVFGGCGSSYGEKADRHTQFAKSAPDAIVIIGLQSAKRYDSFLGIEGGHPPITLYWGRLEPGYETATRGQKFSVDTIKRLLGLHSSAAQDMTMHVMRIPAGTYMLTGIGTAFVNRFYTTVTPLKSGSMYFTVRPGDVRYIGDLHIDAVSFPAKIVMLTRTDLLAKAELYKSPGIHVRPFFQEPTYYPKSDSSPVPFPVTSLTTQKP